MTRRTEKVADLLQTEVADLLRREVKHHALADLMLSITRVEVAPDFTNARIHVSVLDVPGKTPTEMKPVIEALIHSEPFLHRELVKRLHMRQVPRLRFIEDRSIAEGDRMTHLMREVAHGEGREF